MSNILEGQIATGDIDPAAYQGLSEGEAIGTDSLRMLDSLAQELADKERFVLAKKDELGKAVAALEDIQENRLPAFMQKYNRLRHDFIDAVTMQKRTIKFVDKWAVAMPTVKVGNKNVRDEAKARAIYAWCRDPSVGLAGIIKKTVEANAALMSDTEVSGVIAAIRMQYPTVETSISEKIEPATLTAQISRLKDAGKPVHEFIRVEPVKRADFVK